MSSEATINNVHEKKKPVRKQRRATKFKKAPQAPKRFKSAYMFFSTKKHPEIRKKLEAGKGKDVTNVAKFVSEEWRKMIPEERAVWEKLAADDKQRYEVEKAMYTGPWKIRACKRTKKDPDAPKRPMSAFLAYAKANRSQAKLENAHLSNTQLTKFLADKWKVESKEDRHIYIEQEQKEREVYKMAISEWRSAQEKKLEDQRKQREQMALSAIANGTTTGYNSMSSGIVDERQRNQLTGNECIPPEQNMRGPPMPGQNTQGVLHNNASYGYVESNQEMAPVLHGNSSNLWNANCQEMPSYTAYEMYPRYNVANQYPQNMSHGHQGDRQDYMSGRDVFTSNYHQQQHVFYEGSQQPVDRNNSPIYNEWQAQHELAQSEGLYSSDAGQGRQIYSGENNQYQNQSGYYQQHRVHHHEG
eukprot:CAMPEP_0172485618 /NCGR_PEP_ID=MMETSP1066-20121228/13713_1 /TAXON_ID=671091 /ORGANISM="Coscinodiscus wailesii, Strain CCMP2513" /LENGTH=414 /DNA_ID=CAMNT_0013250981 /DNA_START=563 /DNA_END=1807 /DNA_ORIENTATION=+